ncbi:MAG: carbonic anhydrase [Rhizobiales bacterium]|nr:carbonic anhydrase [Hyphomicrobiales bacterium]
MCEVCHQRMLGRRDVLGLAGMGLAAAATGLFSQEAMASGNTTTLTADQALEKLKAGNARYVANPQLCVADLTNNRSTVAKGQAPWASFVSCADSRVPPELLFGGVGLGELFVSRNAGNMVDTATMGTLEYGAEHLGVPLIVVLGHERCGAVAAAVEVFKTGAKLPGSIGPMVKPIVPAVKAISKKEGDMVDNAVRENARLTAEKIKTQSPIIAHLIKAGKVKVVAARYDLDDGKVEFFA